jgi:hypothetical protein
VKVERLLGFWQDANGIVQLWKPRESKMPMIPYKDNRGRIQACQIRLHKGDISEFLLFSEQHAQRRLPGRTNQQETHGQRQALSL